MIPGTITRKKNANAPEKLQPFARNSSQNIVEETKSSGQASGGLVANFSPENLREKVSRQIAAELGPNSTQPISRREAFRTAVYEIGDLLVRGLRGVENVKRDWNESVGTKS